MLYSVLVFAISATFVGLGLGRFAFSPLIPELVETGWLDVAAAQNIGAANLVGYFAGAVLARPALSLLCERRLCTASGMLVVLSYAMFLLPVSTGLLWSARFMAGMGGAVLMVVATAAAGRQLVRLDRTRCQPALFVGIGLGALFAALCLPSLLQHGIGTCILVLLILSAVAVVVLWRTGGFIGAGQTVPDAFGQPVRGANPAIILILAAYACDALGFVMHTVYLPDMLRRIHGYSEAQIGISWAFFGIGACFGPVFVVAIRRVLSHSDALWVAFALKALGVGLVLFTSNLTIACLSLFVVGMLTPGLVIMTSAVLASLSPPGRYLGLWATATGLFALGQMAGGVIIASISTGGYDMSLVMSVAILSVGAMMAMWAKYISPARRSISTR